MNFTFVIYEALLYFMHLTYSKEQKFLIGACGSFKTLRVSW